MKREIDEMIRNADPQLSENDAGELRSFSARLVAGAEARRELVTACRGLRRVVNGASCIGQDPSRGITIGESIWGPIVEALIRLESLDDEVAKEPGRVCSHGGGAHCPDCRPVDESEVE